MAIELAPPGDLVWLRPAWLLAFLPLAVLAWRAFRSPERVAGPWIAVVAAPLRPHVLDPGNAGTGQGWFLATLAVMVLALAGPAQRTSGPDIAWRGDAARVLLVDLAPGPAAAGGDAVPVESLRTALLELLAGMPEGETAMVVYAEAPFTAVPFSTDPATLRRYVPELAPAIMPRAGDDPAAALAFAADLLRHNGSGRRAVVWLTAGRTLPGELPPSLLAGIDLHIVALGRAAALGEFGAAVGAGLHFHDPTGRGLAALRQALAGNSGRPGATASPVVVRDLGPYLVLALVPLAALALRRARLLALAVPILSGGLLLASSPPAQAFSVAEGIAYGRFVAGDYDRAAEGFTDPRWRAAALYRAGRYAESAAALAGLPGASDHYNRGNALARAGQLLEALAAFEAALALDPEDRDARHNRDLVRELLRSPPPPPPPATGGRGGEGPPEREPDSRQREAEILAEQWLRRAGDDPAGLLERKLRLEQRRRDAIAGRARQ